MARYLRAFKNYFTANKGFTRLTFHYSVEMVLYGMKSETKQVFFHRHSRLPFQVILWYLPITKFIKSNLYSYSSFHSRLYIIAVYKKFTCRHFRRIIMYLTVQVPQSYLFKCVHSLRKLDKFYLFYFTLDF